MLYKTDYRQWDHLCRAFGAELQMISDWSEAIIPNGHSVVVLDEPGEHSLSSFEHPENVVYVFGRTGLNNLASFIDCDACVRIEYEPDLPLFGISACSMVLYDRSLKQWQ